MPQPNQPSTTLDTFLAAVTQFQSARRVLFDTLATQPHIVLLYTETLTDRFTEIEGGELLQELHLFAKESLGATAAPRRSKARISH